MNRYHSFIALLAVATAVALLALLTGALAPGTAAAQQIAAPLTTIVVDSGEKGLLLHDDTYANFELQVEFKAAKGSNSGVFLNTKPNPKSLTRECYELNIAPTDNPFPTGSLVARAKFTGAGETGDWRKFDIRVEGARVTVHLDGKEAIDFQGDSPSEGNRIGLQLNSGRVAFRNIKVRKL